MSEINFRETPIKRIAFDPILFRGKDILSGEWFEGSLIIIDKRHYILPEIGPTYALHYEPYDIVNMFLKEVDPKTVSRWLPWWDWLEVSGKKVFEGDICEFFIPECKRIEGQTYPKYYGVVVEDATFRDIKNNLHRVHPQDCFDMRVIGNIYDNPEMLEVGYKFDE